MEGSGLGVVQDERNQLRFPFREAMQGKMEQLLRPENKEVLVLLCSLCLLTLKGELDSE